MAVSTMVDSIRSPPTDTLVTYESPKACSVVAPKGCIVRAGCNKKSTWVMKLLPGMEALAVGEALEPRDGCTVRVKLVEPVAGWTTLRMLRPYAPDDAWGSCAAAAAAPPTEGTTERLLRALVIEPRDPPVLSAHPPRPWRFPAVDVDDGAGGFERRPHRVAAIEKANDGDRASPVFAVDAPMLRPRGAPGAAVAVAGAAVAVAGALSRAEAAALVAATEAMGYDDARNSAVRRNDMCAVVVAEADAAELFRRVRGAVPATVAVGDKTVGPATTANRRWRFYRYAAGARFLPHFDAAWPAAALDGAGVLVHDATGRALSWYTLLVYLSDGFDGGATRLHGTDGAVDVLPAAGGALLFPHGHHPASVYHEGAAVASGTKYVLRTDVLYASSTVD